MKSAFFNPFAKYTEKQLLPIGVAVTIISVFLADYTDARYDGVLDLHFISNVSITKVLTDFIINIVLLFIALLTVGKIINKKTRPVDILTTIVVARIPFYAVMLVNINKTMQTVTDKLDITAPTITNLNSADMSYIIIAGIITIVAVAWYIALLYNGFKIASNAKTFKQNILFIIALIAAEVISKLIIVNLN